MEKAVVYCPDLECDRCVRSVNNVLKDSRGIHGYVFRKDSVDVRYDSSSISPDRIVSLVASAGFRASLSPFLRKPFIERCSDFIANREKYAVETRMFIYSALVFAVLVMAELAVYLGIFRDAPGFFGKYAAWFFYLDLALVSIGAAMWHVNSYRGPFTNMSGMMIGMIFGMQSGLMVGTIIGATSGLLVGALSGMAFAIGVGFYNGRVSGITGVLEGVMAGMMNGVMGAMVGVMFLVDRIHVFMPFFMFVNVLVMWGLSYMLFEEVVEGNQSVSRVNVDLSALFLFVFISAIVLGAIMVYAPKSGLAAVI